MFEVPGSPFHNARGWIAHSQDAGKCGWFHAVKVVPIAFDAPSIRIRRGQLQKPFP